MLSAPASLSIEIPSDTPPGHSSAHTGLFPGVLTMVVVKARGLLNRETFGTSDPYVKVSFHTSEATSVAMGEAPSTTTSSTTAGDMLGTTSVVSSNLNPTWPEAKSTFSTTIHREPTTKEDASGWQVTESTTNNDTFLQCITCHVWDKNVGKDSFMGIGTLVLGEIFTQLLDEGKLKRLTSPPGSAMTGEGGESSEGGAACSPNGAPYTAMEVKLAPGAEKALHGKALGTLTVKLSYMPDPSPSQAAAMQSSLGGGGASGSSFGTGEKEKDRNAALGSLRDEAITWPVSPPSLPGIMAPPTNKGGVVRSRSISRSPLHLEQQQHQRTRSVPIQPLAPPEAPPQQSLGDVFKQISKELERSDQLKAETATATQSLELLREREKKMLTRRQGLMLALLVHEACEKRSRHTELLARRKQ